MPRLARFAMRFTTDCVHSDGESITAMTERARAITRATFLRHAHRGDQVALERRLGYDTGAERGGLRMAKDWHVGYYRSIYRGAACVYFVHSHIEYVFTRRAVA